jgi:hypothetical protein
LEKERSAKGTAKEPQPERGKKRKAKVATLAQQVETLMNQVEKLQAEVNALKAQLKQGQADPGFKKDAKGLAPGLGGAKEKKFDKGAEPKPSKAAQTFKEADDEFRKRIAADVQKKLDAQKKAPQ